VLENEVTPLTSIVPNTSTGSLKVIFTVSLSSASAFTISGAVVSSITSKANSAIAALKFA
jgi:hypothetical protein